MAAFETLEERVGLLNEKDREEVDNLVNHMLDSYSSKYDYLQLNHTGLEERYVKAIDRAFGVKTVGELARKTESDIVGSRNLGGKALLYVKRMLGKLGVSLRGSEVEHFPDVDELRKKPVNYLFRDIAISCKSLGIETLGELSDKFDEVLLQKWNREKRASSYQKLQFYELK